MTRAEVEEAVQREEELCDAAGCADKKCPHGVLAALARAGLDAVAVAVWTEKDGEAQVIHGDISDGAMKHLVTEGWACFRVYRSPFSDDGGE